MNKLFGIVFIALTSLFVLISCGGGGGVSTGDGSVEQTIEFPRTANPLTVAVELNNTNSAQAAISAAGGSVELILTNGTRAVLEVPESALLSSVDIKLTEVKAIAGIPFAAGYESAVHFEPEGLRFLTPAVLQLFPAAGQSVSGLTGFSYHGLGAEFHLYPLEILSDSVKFELMHFSGFGAGNASSQEKKDQRDNHPPSSDEDQANQDNDQEASQEKNYALMLAWWSTVNAQITQAISTEAVLEAAYVQYLSWYHALLKDPVSFGKLTSQRVLSEQGLGLALINALQRSYERCVSNTNVNEVGKIVRWYFWTLSKPELYAQISDASLFEYYVKTCAKFELEFKSLIIENPDSASGRITTEIEAVVPIMLSYPGSVPALTTLALTGSMPSVYLQAEAVFDGCPSTFSGIDGSVFRVIKFEIDLNYIDDPAAPAVPWFPNDVTMWIDHGSPKEHLYLHCPPAPDINNDMTIWSGGWGALHKSELDKATGNGFKIQFWNPGIGSVFAEKTYQGDGPLGVFRETTTLKLKHTPW